MTPSPQILDLAALLARLEQAGRQRRRQAAPGLQLAESAASHSAPRERVALEWLAPFWPAAGAERGALVEWIGDAGSGAGSLALAMARQTLAQSPGALVVIDGQPVSFYAPAAAAAGLDLDRTLLVCPAHARDRAWALEQALRSPGLAATLCWLPAFRTMAAAGRALRRWQLAAELHGAWGVFVRPLEARREPSFAAWRLLVTPVAGAGESARRVQVEVISGPGRSPGRSTLVEVDDETGHVHLVPPLAARALARRRA
jgi:hypothetical protein